MIKYTTKQMNTKEYIFTLGNPSSFYVIYSECHDCHNDL